MECGVVYGVILLEWYCGVWSGRFGVILWSVEWTFWSGIWSDIVGVVVWSDIVGVDVLEWYME